MILHIPHSSTQIPFRDGFIGEQEVQHEINLLTDWYTDELFSYENAVTVKAGFSRIFCDVERFADDNQEVMAKFGMGVCYTKTDDGLKLREVTDDLKARILNEYYWKHHEKLDQAVEKELNETGKALILDCHSFPDTPFKRDLIQDPNRPDINIGSDPFHTPQELINYSSEFFKSKGFNVQLNDPYSGTIVPLIYYQKNQQVRSIMLELNRRLYLDPKNTKKKSFFTLKEMIQEYTNRIYQILDEK